jgi:hypothetical protein
MNSMRKLIAERVGSLIGDGAKFRSAREMAQTALNKGYGPNLDSLTRNINRLRKAEVDPQLSTLEAISAAAGVRVSDLLSPSVIVSAEMRDIIDMLLVVDSNGGLNRSLILNTLRLALGKDSPDERQKHA